jgi:hypothetical protein
MRTTFILLICSLLLACKKNSVEEIQPPVITNPTSDSLKGFSINLEDSTTSTARISWTSAGDSSKTTYSVFLNDTIVASKVTKRNFEFSSLVANRTYIAKVTAYGAGNDSISRTIQFATKDPYLKFARQLPPDVGNVYGMTLTHDGGYIFIYGGARDTFFVGDGKPGTVAIRIMKVDSLGSVKWSKRYDYVWQGPSLAKIRNTANGYLIMLQRGVLKIDYEGNVVWTYLLSTPEYQVFNAFLETQNGDIIISGDQLPPFSSALIRLNSNGQLLWKREYPLDDSYLTVRDLVEIPSEHSFVMFGMKSNSRYGLLKIDDSGEKLWERSFGDTLTNGLAGFLHLVGNQILVSGATVGDYYLHTLQVFRFDFNGNLQHTVSLSEPNGADAVRSFQLTKDGGSIVLGNIGTMDGPYFIRLFKLDAHDNKEWEVTYRNFDLSNMIQQTSDGGYAFIAYSPYYRSYFLIKTNPLGEL